MTTWKPGLPTAPCLMDSGLTPIKCFRLSENFVSFVSFLLHGLQLKSVSAGMAWRVNILLILWAQNCPQLTVLWPSILFFHLFDFPIFQIAPLWYGKNIISVDKMKKIQIHNPFFSNTCCDHPIKFYSAGEGCLLWGKLQHFLGVSSLLFGLFASVSQV